MIALGRMAQCHSGEAFKLRSIGHGVSSQRDKAWASCSNRPLTTWYWSKDGVVLQLGRWPQAWRKVMSAYRRWWLKKSLVGWLPVHRDQLRAQHSVTSIGELYCYLLSGDIPTPLHPRSRPLSHRIPPPSPAGKVWHHRQPNLDGEKWRRCGWVVYPDLTRTSDLFAICAAFLQDCGQSSTCTAWRNKVTRKYGTWCGPSTWTLLNLRRSTNCSKLWRRLVSSGLYTGLTTRLLTHSADKRPVLLCSYYPVILRRMSYKWNDLLD